MLLRSDPLALAPERLLVFEVKGSISSFVKAVNRVPGLELVDEEDLPSDEDKQPVAYLLVPDMQALREIESLWRRWTEGEELGRGFAGWRDVFSCLRDLRVWGPNDRVLVTCPSSNDLRLFLLLKIGVSGSVWGLI